MLNRDLQVLIDWLQFTLKTDDEEYAILQVLNLQVADFTQLEKGRFGYKQCKICGNISVLYDGNKGMGVHIVMSGKGCREYETTGNMYDLLGRIKSKKGKVTRIDIAIDDKTGKIILFNEIQKDVVEGNVISKWKTATEITKRKLADGKIEGKTINFGSRTSEIFMRIYDKALETSENSEKNEKSNENDENVNWVRMEVEIKGKKAEKIHNIILITNIIGMIIAQILNNYIRFVEKSKDKNKSRWKTREYWEKIICETGKLKLSSDPKERTIDDLKNWIEKQIAPSLALIVIDDGGAVDDIYKMISEARYRLKPRHIRMLSNKGDNYVK